MKDDLWELIDSENGKKEKYELRNSEINESGNILCLWRSYNPRKSYRLQSRLDKVFLELTMGNHDDVQLCPQKHDCYVTVCDKCVRIIFTNDANSRQCYFKNYGFTFQWKNSFILCDKEFNAYVKFRDNLFALSMIEREGHFLLL